MMLVLDPFEFDQSDNGWRSLEDTRDRISALEGYLEENSVNGEWVEKYAHSPLKTYHVHFHLAQNYLKMGWHYKSYQALLLSLSYKDTTWDCMVKWDQYGLETYYKDTIFTFPNIEDIPKYLTKAAWAKDYSMFLLERCKSL